ncbi:AAA family ATPase [bacterium]|nr:AAA family ATPase [bacterium]
MELTDNKPFLWVERWAPESVEDLILTKSVKEFFTNVVNEGQLNQNLILQGSQGCGKTQTIKTLCKITKQDVLFLNGSSEGRYLDTIRNQVINFGTTVSMFNDKKKVVFFDEFDGTTNDVMLCLRGVIEQLHNNVCFIFTCNNLNKIIEPIQSRCVVLKYTPISKNEKPELMVSIFNRMSHILDEENIEYDKKVVAELIKNYFPDTRQLLNTLQRYAKGGKIDSAILATFSDVKVNDLIKYLKEKNFPEVRKWIVANLDNDATSILRMVYDALYEHLDGPSIAACVLIVAKYQYQSAFVADQEINLLAALTEIMIESNFK